MMRWIEQMERVWAIVLVCVLALLLGRLPTGKLPQVVNSNDVLSVAFCDARAVIAQMMIRKSDSYFHGGVDVDCSCDNCKEGYCEGLHHDQSEEAHAKEFDPWEWIDAHVMAPQRHIHLDGKKVVELMPFYWVALRTNPHDVEAWTTAIFIASDHLKDNALAERLIDEAKTHNPDSAEIAFAEGKYKRKNGNGDLFATKKCFERAKWLLSQKGKENWTEEDSNLSNLIEVFFNSAK